VARFTAITLVTILLWDLALRLLVRPSPTGDGQLFGQDLPPYTIVQAPATTPDRSNRCGSLRAIRSS